MTDAKRTANLVARAAMAGFELRAVPDGLLGEGTFTAERWGHIKFLADIDEAERWLEMVAGKVEAS